MNKIKHTVILTIMCLLSIALAPQILCAKPISRKQQCFNNLWEMTNELKTYQLKTHTVLEREIPPEEFEKYAEELKSKGYYLSRRRPRKQCRYGITLEGSPNKIGVPYCTYHGTPVKGCKTYYNIYKGNDYDFPLRDVFAMIVSVLIFIVGTYSILKAEKDAIKKRRDGQLNVGIDFRHYKN